MSVADVVRKTERRINALAAKRSKNAGWEPEIIGFTGYGNAERVRVFGRVLLKDPAKKRDEERNKKRGFWQFFTVELADFPVTIITGLVFMVCVLLFRRGLVGEFFASRLGRRLGFRSES